MLFTSLFIPSRVANLNTLHLFMSVPKESKFDTIFKLETKPSQQYVKRLLFSSLGS